MSPIGGRPDFSSRQFSSRYLRPSNILTNDDALADRAKHLFSGLALLVLAPLLLPVGRLLRKTKLNELPQLLNILRGEMSVVGPRPQDQRCFDVFREEDKREIIKVPPGLSGLGAIFFRDEENILERAVERGQDRMAFYDQIISPYKGQLEAWYVRHRNLKNYFLVIFVTIRVVLFPQSKILPKAFPHLPSPPPELR